MSQKLQPVRGTRDILPEEYVRFCHIIEKAREVGQYYGFEEMALPIFEFTEVFKRTLGETSDVVNKEMYTFADRGGEEITLRPEFTAGIARAFVSNGLQQRLPLKLFTQGPLFRYERPQKGRYRQFHQINFEYLGVDDSYADAEVIFLAIQILDTLGLLQKVKLEINTLGDAVSRERYTKVLISYLQGQEKQLSEDSKVRMAKNPLRILDSKDEDDRKIVANAPVIYEFLTQAAKDRFERVLDIIDQHRCGLFEFELNPEYRVVRGLDYYSHTVFEFVAQSDDLGAQNTVLAGGRYNKLIAQFGGQEVSGVGFAAGIERLMLMVSGSTIATGLAPVVIVGLGGEEARNLAAKTVLALRAGERCAEMILSNNVGKAIGKANKMHASHVVIIGGDEVQKKKAKIKDMKTSQEVEKPISEIPKVLIEDLLKEGSKSYDS